MNLLTWICLAPLAGFVWLTFVRDRFGEVGSALVGVGSVGISAVLSAIFLYGFVTTPPSGGVLTEPLWTWMQIGTFAPTFALSLDAVSATMLGVVTGVG